jgi:hypothetical protein
LKIFLGDSRISKLLCWISNYHWFLESFYFHQSKSLHHVGIIKHFGIKHVNLIVALFDSHMLLNVQGGLVDKVVHDVPYKKEVGILV